VGGRLVYRIKTSVAQRHVYGGTEGRRMYFSSIL